MSWNHSLFYATELTKQQAARDQLEQHFIKLIKRRPATKLADAIWSGHWALRGECNQLAERAQATGVLLFAWDGAKGLEEAAR